MSFSGCRQNWVREVIVESRLYFASREEFNDPTDSTANVLLSGDEVAQAAILRQIARKKTAIFDPRREFLARNVDTVRPNSQADVDRIAQGWRRSVDRLGMVSLSGKPNSPLLWSHYADKHRGICLKFKTDVPEAPFFSDARRIRYRLNLPDFDIDSVDREEQIASLLLTKGSAWRYEAEWRLINTKRRGHCDIHLSSLVGVIFGWKMSAQPRQTILRWVQESGKKVVMFKCEPSKANGYRLRVYRIRSTGQSV